MSGIGPNPLNPLSKIYLECISENKKDDTYLEPDMKKRQTNNEKARKEMAKVKGQKNPHFEEKQQGWDSVNSLFDVYKGMHEEGYGAPGHNPGSGEKSVARAKALMDKKGEKGAPGLDAMMAANKEHKARRGVKKEEVEQVDENRAAARAAGGYKDDSKKQNDPSKAGFTGIGNMSIDQIRKMSARMDKEKTQKEGLDPVGKEDGDVNNDGKKDKTDKYLMNRRKAIGNAIKGKMSSMKKEETDVDKYIETVSKVKEAERKNDVQRWTQKESYSSDWRQDLSEIMTDDIDSKPIKEKTVKNKIKINPKLGEAVEEMGGELIEMSEISEYEYMVEGLRQELIDEGHDAEAVNYALEEAKVTMGHDTPGNKEGTRDKLKKKAKGFLGKIAYKGYHAARDAKRAASPMLQRIKTSAKRGVRKAALKIADKLKEESVDEAMTVTNADKKGNTPAYQAYKAGKKDKGGKPMYKAADHMKEGDGDPCWDSHKQVGMKKKGGKMVPNCVPKNEEVEVEEGMKPLPKNKMFRKAGNLGRDVVSPSVTDDQRQKAYDRSKKIVKTLNKANEEVENVEEIYKGKHGQTEKQYQDSRSNAGKMVSGDSKGSGANYSYRAKNTGSNPAGGSEKPQGQARMGSKDRAYLKMQKANLRKEDASMTPQEIALQKRKAMLDRMIAQKRQQGLNTAKKSEAPAKAMGEATEDSLKDRRMERGGVDGNNRYNSAPKNVAMGGGKKKPYDGMSALEKVKASIRAKHGQGAIMDTKKK